MQSIQNYGQPDWMQSNDLLRSVNVTSDAISVVVAHLLYVRDEGEE